MKEIRRHVDSPGGRGAVSDPGKRQRSSSSGLTAEQMLMLTDTY